MRENLLKKQPTWGLRRAQGSGQKSATPATLTKVILVLLTMFLIPSAAWGEGEYISSTFSGINLGQGVGPGPISYNSATATTSTTDASTPRIMQGSTATGWDVKNLSANYSICTGANNATSSETNFVLRPIDRGQANTITFTLESQFGINGKFVKAEIIYNYSYIKSITADANKKAGSEIISLVNSNVSFTCSESGTAEEATGTITANASDYSNMVFDNNNIDLSFTVTTAAVQSGIPSFTISEIRLYFEDVTEQPFNIWVNGTSLTGQNITTFLDGKLGYTQPDGNKPAILHLKGTTAIQSIYTTLEDLEIHLSGENQITPSSQLTNGICSSQSRDEGTLTFTTEEGGSLTITTGVSVIRGFGKCTGNLETHEPYNMTNYLTNGAYYYLSTNSEGTDTTTIKWLKITEAQTYPLWIAGTQVTERNKGNVLGDSKVSFTPADNTTTPATPATLTLDNATLTVSTDGGAAIESSLDNLIVYLVGDNTVQAQAGSQNITSFYAFKGNSNNTITFQTNVQEPGKIQGLVLEQYVFNAVTPAYQEGLGLTRDGDNFEIGVIKYGLTIGGTVVTALNADNVLGDGKVSFEPAKVVVDQTGGSTPPATLTLNGATINGDIVWDGSASAPLTIEIAGMNTVINNAGENAAVSAIRSGSAASATTCSLTIAKKDDAESATLKLAGYNTKGGNADAFTNFNLSTELNNVSVTSEGITYYYYTSEPTYDLTVAGIQVHGISGELGYRENVLQDRTVSFTPANEANNTPATLTLNGASLTAGIVTGMNMSIDLKGNNSITVNGGYALSVPNNESPTITFTSSSSPIGNLTLKSTASEVSGLVGGNINILYDTSKGIVPSFLVTTADPTTANFTNSTEAVITNGTAYGLYIADVPVTNSNASGITGSGIEGTVTYTDATKTLTLNGAEITGNISSSSISELKVYLIGKNSITPTSDTTPFAYTGAVGTTSPQLSFESSDTDEGELTINGVFEQPFGSFSYEEFSDETTAYHQWMKESNENENRYKIYYNPKYGIKVGDYETYKANKDNITAISGDYQISYSPDDNTLKIPATTETFASTSIVSSRASLNIIISGTSKIGSISFEATDDVTSGTLTIKRDTQSETNTIILENNGGVITGFSEVTIEAPLHVLEPFGQSVWDSSVTSAEISDWTWSGVEEIFAGNNTYATYYNQEVDTYLPSGYTPYVITDVSGSSVTTQALSYIPKGAMVLIAKSENTATTAVTTGNMLKYADSDNPVTATETSNYYVLYNGKFVKVTRGTTIGGPDSGSGCYLDLSGVTAAGTRSFYDIDGSDGTTAIKDVKSGEVDGEKWADGGWHDLQGRRLSAKPTKPGLYILNGKKVAIK